MPNQSTDPRGGLMAALSAAERVVALSPAPPVALRVQQHSAFPADTFGVELHYAAPEVVREVATSLQVEPVVDEFWFGDSLHVETSVIGALDGVPVRVWTQLLATRTEIEVQEQAAAVEAWNSAHPIGTAVAAYPGLRGTQPLLTETRSLAWLLGGHTAVVMVKDRSGCIALTHVDPWEDKAAADLPTEPPTVRPLAEALAPDAAEGGAAHA